MRFVDMWWMWSIHRVIHELSTLFGWFRRTRNSWASRGPGASVAAAQEAREREDREGGATRVRRKVARCC